LGIVVSRPLTKTEFREYDPGREVAKNVFFSFVFLGLTLVVVYLAFSSLAKDTAFSGIDVLLVVTSVISLIIQLRIYDSERRIYNGKVSSIPFSTARKEASAPPHGRTELASGLKEESAMSSKPIFERVDPTAFAKSVSEASENIEQLIEEDKRRTELELSNSKWSDMFELSGVRAKKKE